MKDNKGQQKKKQEAPKSQLNAEQQKLMDIFKAFDQEPGTSPEVAATLACAYYAKNESEEVVPTLPQETEPPAPTEPGSFSADEPKVEAE